jgi:hypothetical protein
MKMPQSPTGQSNNDNSNKNETITVVARVRPILPREADEEQVLFVDDGGSRLSVYANGSDTPSLYRFDRVFNASAAQADVFTTTALPLVNACCQGYNAAVFAYGQTGTGKTHTMLGVDLWDIALRTNQNSINSDENVGDRSALLSSSEGRGVIPRSMERVFEYCTEVRTISRLLYFISRSPLPCALNDVRPAHPHQPTNQPIYIYCCLVFAFTIANTLL